MGEHEAAGFYLTFLGDAAVFSQEVITSGPKVARRAHWEPRVDILEEPGRIVVTAELAGVKGEEITLGLLAETNTLVIRGYRHEPYPEGRRVAHQLEIPYGEFEREVALPDVSLDRAGVSASCRHGFLVVSIPKA